MEEYKSLKKQYEEDEDDEEKEEEEEDEEHEDEDEDNIFGLGKPQEKIECPQFHGLGTMVNDHDHAIQLNNFRGKAHAHCNIQYKKNQFLIPIWAHNGMKYDFHFIFRTIGENIKEYKEEETIIIKNKKRHKERKDCFQT